MLVNAGFLKVITNSNWIDKKNISDSLNRRDFSNLEEIIIFLTYKEKK